jgi:hypothetical protein
MTSFEWLSMVHGTSVHDIMERVRLIYVQYFQCENALDCCKVLLFYRWPSYFWRKYLLLSNDYLYKHCGNSE